MEVSRVGLLFVLVLGICWVSDARHLLTSDDSSSEATIDLVSDFSVPLEYQKREDGAEEDLEEVVCALCQKFTTQALNYLADNKTQTDIIGLLHSTCSQMWTMKKKCMTMVDFYAPLFFSEVSSIKPSTFCQDVDLCSRTSINSPSLFQRSCEFCHRAVAEASLKLKDPNRQVGTMELLLKGCDALKARNIVKKCKNMVSEYGPLLLTNAEIYLETADICNTLHACHVPTIN